MLICLDFDFMWGFAHLPYIWKHNKVKKSLRAVISQTLLLGDPPKQNEFLNSWGSRHPTNNQ